VAVDVNGTWAAKTSRSIEFMAEANLSRNSAGILGAVAAASILPEEVVLQTVKMLPDVPAPNHNSCSCRLRNRLVPAE
jgi:hypothetical protein